MASKGYVAIPGSEREPMPGATKSGPCDPKESVQVTVVLRPRPLGKKVKPLDEVDSQRGAPDPSEYEARYGADPKDVERVRGVCARPRPHGLRRESRRANRQAHGDRRRLQQGVSSGLGALCRVPKATYRGRTGSVYVPAALKGVIASVHGLDNRPQAQAHFRISVQRARRPGRCDAKASSSVSYTPLQVAQLYDFPAGANGQGQTIGIIELGGGYTQSDLDSYFSALGISPAPSVSAVSVDGAQNQPTGDTSGPDAEVMLDIEVAGSVAPGAKIAVYFAPNTDAGFLDAINQAVGDKQNNPSVISISWGGPESTWTAQSLQSYNSALEAASAVGVSVCIAAGDDGSTDGVTDGLAARRLPRLQSLRPGLRRDAPGRQRQHDHRRGGVERPSQRRGHGRRRQRNLPASHLAGGRPRAALRQSGELRGPRGAGRGRRRRSRYRLSGGGGRQQHRGGRNQRRRPAVGGLDRLLQLQIEDFGWLLQSHPLPANRGRGRDVPRHHLRQ